MHKNKYYLILLIIISIACLWFVGKAGIAIREYLLLNKSADGTVQDWSIDQISKNQYVILGSFLYSYKEKIFEGKSPASASYPNYWAAKKNMEKFYSKNNWKVWFNPNNPQQATLMRSFPYKSLICALIMIGLTIYFYFLGRYATNFQP